MNGYECDCCGACCSGPLIVEADLLDALREPRLLAADVSGSSPTSIECLDGDRCLVLAAGNYCCQFLGEDKRCGIYPTRPNGCVAFEAGSEQCQYARQAAGLAPLEKKRFACAQR